jgi:dTDP-4-dehydrorhamnose reductase
MKVAILGASGLLGKYLVREWSGDEVIGFSSKDVDIRRADDVRRLLTKISPTWVVLAAAYTDVDGCETNRELAFETNHQGAVNVAEAASASGARLLFLSSDYVFDGNKHSPYDVGDVRNPLSVYGQTKAQAEVDLARMLPSCSIVRTSWVFGVGGKCFPDTIVRAAATREELEVVDDQRGSPTYARDLARAIVELCRQDASGIVHVTNRGDCTWFQFAQEIVRFSGLKAVVRPTTTDRFPRPAKRPKNSVLSAASLEEYKIAMPSWQEALRDYLRERTAQ